MEALTAVRWARRLAARESSAPDHSHGRSRDYRGRHVRHLCDRRRLRRAPDPGSRGRGRASAAQGRRRGVAARRLRAAIGALSRVAAPSVADHPSGGPENGLAGPPRVFLRPRPTFSLAARHNQCRTDSACRTDFGGGKSVGPPWRARRSHFSRVRASSLFGTGAAHTGARPSEPPGQPPRLRTLHALETNRRLARRGFSGRSVGPAEPVGPAPRPAELQPSVRAGRASLGRPPLGKEGAASLLGSSRLGRHRSPWRPRPRWGAGRGHLKIRASEPTTRAHRPSPSHAAPGGRLAREGPTGSVVRAGSPRFRP